MTDKNYTSLKDNGKKGFGTFILTLSISLIVFSTIYYLMTTSSTESDDFDTSLSVMEKAFEDNDQPEVQGDQDTQKSIFGEISEAKPEVSYRQVLSGATVAETTQSTTALDTGVTSITIGLIFAFIVFLSAIIYIHKNPRKLALTSFEKRTTKGL